MSEYPVTRPMRRRRSDAIRRLVAETRLHPGQLVMPLFVTAGSDSDEPIMSMPGQARWSVDRLGPIVDRAARAGIGGIMVFGIPATKDDRGSGAWDPEGPVPSAIRFITEHAPDLTVWADVCLCEYTDHGHCGVITDGRVDGDASLPSLADAAVVYADAGVDVVAPSDMFDGRIGAIRTALDAAGHTDLAICSYAVKYASAFYGPFRDAAGSAPAFGDRRTHQMDPANRREARIEVDQDIREGADIVMVKPAGHYLDIVADIRRSVDVPVAAYQVSGEYAMVEAAASRGWIDGDRIMLESLTSITRAGADIILTYFAIRAAEEMGST